MKNKKADFALDNMAKLIIALIILGIIIVLIFLIKNKSWAQFDKIRSLLRFGL